MTLEALAPFRAPAVARPAGDPAPLPYLGDEHDGARAASTSRSRCWLATRAHARAKAAPPVLAAAATCATCTGRPAQMVAHHTSNGCNLRPGDLIASGTVSGPRAGERAAACWS